MLIVHERCNGANADAHSSKEHEGIKLLPLFPYFSTLNNLGVECSFQGVGNFLASLTDLYDCYLHNLFLWGYHSIVSTQVHKGEEAQQTIVVGIEIAILEGFVLGIPQSINKLLLLSVVAKD